jgi:hypothetical protein
MAPEQARGEPVDHRADLFSLGSVLYAMCTGRPPFRATGTMAALRAVAEDTPRPVRQVNPETPIWVAEIIEKLHAKDPDLRFQSATEVADLLGRHLTQLKRPDAVSLPVRLATGGAAPVRRPKGQPWKAAAAGVLIALCLFGMTEGGGVTNLIPTIIRILTPRGALIVEVDDPHVQVTLGANGEDVLISGAGVHELQLRLGTYQWKAIRDGEVVEEDWVSITRDGKPRVRVHPDRADHRAAAVK